MPVAKARGPLPLGHGPPRSPPGLPEPPALDVRFKPEQSNVIGLAFDICHRLTSSRNAMDEAPPAPGSLATRGR
jgi:hypothetical protein